MRQREGKKKSRQRMRQREKMRVRRERTRKGTVQAQVDQIAVVAANAKPAAGSCRGRGSRRP